MPVVQADNRRRSARAATGAILLCLATVLSPQAATAKAPRWNACGSYSNAASRVAIASYAGKGIGCRQALNIILTARRRAPDRSVVMGFQCRRTLGEAESWYLCTSGARAARAHSVVF